MLIFSHMIDEILTSLCALPHRYSTSGNEHRAAKYLTEKVAELDIEVERAPFVAPTTFSWIYLLIYLGFVIAAVAVHYHPLAALGVALLLAAVFVGEQTTRWTPLSRWVPQGLSHNVIGRLPAPGKAEAVMVLSAHYDTSKTAAAFHPRMVASLRRSYVISVIMIAAVVAGALAASLAPAGAARAIAWALAAPGLYLAVMGLLMLEREVRGVPVNGAADNASGVAVVMELAKRLVGAGGLAGWNVIILLTGAEEVGMAGMTRFLAEEGRGLDRRSTVFINFDNLGGGTVCYLTHEGMLRRLAADPELLRAAHAVAQEPAFTSVQARPFTALTLDTLVPHARGYRTLSIMGLNDANVPQPWHWFNDTLPNLDRGLVTLAADFAWELIHRVLA
jgi:hypothetical protein